MMAMEVLLLFEDWGQEQDVTVADRPPALSLTSNSTTDTRLLLRIYITGVPVAPLHRPTRLLLQGTGVANDIGAQLQTRYGFIRVEELLI